MARALQDDGRQQPHERTVGAKLRIAVRSARSSAPSRAASETAGGLVLRCRRRRDPDIEISGRWLKIGVDDRTQAMAVIIVLAWLLAMLGLFGWLLWWDRSDGRDEQEPPRTLAAILDEAVARAMNGDEACERLLWKMLADYLSDSRHALDLRTRPRTARA